jgi:Rrf2 family protein
MQKSGSPKQNSLPHNVSMQLTRAADYAVRVMIHLATLPEEERALLPTLAVATGAPGSFLSKVLQSLSRAGLIVSWRGQLGGFAILTRGRQASIRSVIEAIDGPIALNVCLQHGPSCSRKSWCPAHLVWVQAQTAMLQVLDKATIADLALQVKGAGEDQSALGHEQWKETDSLVNFLPSSSDSQ